LLQSGGMGALEPVVKATDFWWTFRPPSSCSAM